MKRIYKHGMVFLVLTVLLLTMIFCYISSSSESIISINGDSIDSVNMQGVVCSVDNNLVRFKTKNDIELLVNSKDPITQIPTYKLPVIVLSIDSKIESITANSFISSVQVNESLKYELEFPYIIKEGRKQIVFYEADYSITKIPNSNKYIVEKGGLLFLLDPETELMDFYCLSETMGYSQRNTKNINGIEYALVWSARPSFNQDGTRMIYYTDRSTEKNGRVWVKDTITGEEKPVPNTPGYSNVLQWRDNRYVYLLSRGKILEIDTTELSSRIIYDTENQGSNMLGFIYPYVFVPGISDKSQVINVINNDVVFFDDTEYSGCSAILTTDIGCKLLITYSDPSDINPYHKEVILLDMETMEKSTISVKDEYTFTTLQSYKSEGFLINYCLYDDIYSQLTVYIDYAQLTVR